MYKDSPLKKHNIKEPKVTDEIHLDSLAKQESLLPKPWKDGSGMHSSPVAFFPTEVLFTLAGYLMGFQEFFFFLKSNFCAKKGSAGMILSPHS